MTTFDELRRLNVQRQLEWCGDNLPDLSFRANELAGEVGETVETALQLLGLVVSAGKISNTVKKLERERQGWRGSRTDKGKLADELADLILCADLVAFAAGVDLGEAVRNKFNRTSEEQGLTVFFEGYKQFAEAVAADTSSTGTKREGFWYSEREPDLPMPEPLPVVWEGKAAFIEALRRVEVNAYSITQRGMSTCRICKKWNGSKEYRLAGWTWPSGLLHYIEEHNVRPSQAFYEFIMGRSA